MIRVPEVKAIVSVNGQRMSFLSLKIGQRMSEHHDFELVIDHQTFDQAFFDTPEKKLALVNTKVVIDLQNGDNISKAYVFSGLITSVRMLARDGQHGAILLVGKSNTIELERGKICQTYSNTNLYTIINDITKGIYNLSVINKPDYKSDISFAIQFKEHDWDFMRRILHQYNVSYHYNGLDLIIGSYPEYPVVNLTYDMELSSLEVCSRLLANEESNYFYRREDHSTISQDSPKTIAGANYYLQDVSKQADYLTRERKPNTPVEAYVPDMDSLINQMERKKVATGAEMMYVKGQVKCCDVLIGRLINIKFPQSMGGAGIGTYRVYEVTHRIDQNGRYICDFEAIPAGLKYFPTPKVEIPVINPIQAECLSNEDPLGIGRIKVQFPFDERSCATWIPVITPDAGGGGHGLGYLSRGYSFLPERKDTVVVSFLDGAVLSQPVVIGSMFHRDNALNLGGLVDGVIKGNHIKTIRTRSGHLIEFNDSENAWGITIRDFNDNCIYFNTTEKSIRISAPEKISILSKDIEIMAKNQLVLSSEKDTQQMVGTEFTQSVGENSTVSVGKNLKVNVDQTMETKVSKDASIDVIGELKQMANKDIKISSGEKAEMQSQSDLTLKSGSNVYISE